ncbi:MAG: CoA pyrophosphatase [Bacteroidales bacterium]|nr:CoA pyrophosphatase [Bacteroidales bacterium]
MDFYMIVNQALKKPLPGIKAQMKMAPEFRTLSEEGSVRKKAAVSIIILPEPSFELILIKRTQYEGYHSGQISFPGGKKEKNDHSLLDTAIRETYEEIGIKLCGSDLLGILTPLQIPVSGFLVSPHVFKYNGSVNFKLDDHEVKYIIREPIVIFFDRNTIKHKTMTLMNTKINVPYYDIQGETIWGATAMILSEFIEILKRTSVYRKK